MSKPPDFIIAGAPRSGTGWMMACLSEHPEVFIPEYEIHYFSDEYDQPSSWYEDHFEGCSSGQVIGEKSPSYLSDPNAAERIYRWNSNVKVIFSLREPVDRSYSLYCMMLRRGDVSEEIEQTLRPGSWLVETGRYYNYLKKYVEIFTEENLHIMVFDDLEDDPKKFARNLFGNIGVDRDFVPSVVSRKFGHRKKRGGDTWSKVRSMSVHLTKSSAVANSLVQWLRRHGYTDWIHRLRSGKDDPALPESVRRVLRSYYSDDVDRLRSYLERPLPDWPG